MSIMKKKKLKLGEIWDKGIRGFQFKPLFYFSFLKILLNLEIKFETNLSLSHFLI
jgi:hypothetical protein